MSLYSRARHTTWHQELMEPGDLEETQCPTLAETATFLSFRAGLSTGSGTVLKRNLGDLLTTNKRGSDNLRSDPGMPRSEAVVVG